MSKRGTLIVLLVVVSEVLGVALGEAGFRLYRVTMPPAAVSQFNLGNAHLWYIVAGLCSGLVLSVWSLIAAMLGRVMLGSKKDAPAAAAPGGTVRPS